MNHTVTATFQNYTDLENGMAALRYNGWNIRSIRNLRLIASSADEEPAYVAQLNELMGREICPFFQIGTAFKRK